MGPEVAPLIETTYFAAASGALARGRATELDRYVRHEFGEPESGWLVDLIRRSQVDPAESDSRRDVRLLRRFVRAFAAIK